MKQNTQEGLKHWVKDWNIRQIISSAVSDGMAFMADKMSNELLTENKSIYVEELNTRFTQQLQNVVEELEGNRIKDYGKSSAGNIVIYHLTEKELSYNQAISDIQSLIRNKLGEK